MPTLPRLLLTMLVLLGPSLHACKSAPAADAPKDKAGEAMAKAITYPTHTEDPHDHERARQGP